MELNLLVPFQTDLFKLKKYFSDWHLKTSLFNGKNSEIVKVHRLKEEAMAPKKGGFLIA